MRWNKSGNPKLTALAVLWLVFTLSLVGWWWWHSMQQAGGNAREQRMYFWEGSFLLSVLLLGGVGLVYLTHRHQERHERLKVFFSTFAHDLKTSIARLRLQGELLEESGAVQDPKVRAVLKEIQRLDLQLENSLWMAQIESSKLLLQKTALHEVMDQLRYEFSEVQLEIHRDAELFVDRRAFIVVLRNLFHNSLLHGQADRIEIQVRGESGGRVCLEISDNGQGLKIPATGLGRNVLSAREQKSNGLGLYLSRRLVERMQGRLEFRSDPGFCNVLTVRGATA